MRIIELPVYKFEELDPKVQEKVIEKRRYRDTEDGGWWENDYLINPPHEELKQFNLDDDLLLKIKDGNKVFFSLDRSWHLDILGAVEVVDDKAFLTWLGFPAEWIGKVSYEFYNDSTRNADTKIKFEYECEDGGDEEDDEEEPANFEEIADAASEKWNDNREESLRNMQKDYDYQTSDEYVKQGILDDNLEYYEDGEVV